MPDGTIKSKTGKATVVKTGHTSNGQFGSDPNKQPKGRSAARPLSK